MSDLEHKITHIHHITTLRNKAYTFTSKYINYKMGSIGAVIMGALVFGVNYYATQDLMGSTTASLKQAGYTLLFGGAVIRGCEYLATTIRNKTKALIASVLIPSAATFMLTYGMHSLRGTPEPKKSTLPTSIILPITFFYGREKRRQLELINTQGNISL